MSGAFWASKGQARINAPNPEMLEGSKGRALPIAFAIDLRRNQGLDWKASAARKPLQRLTHCDDRHTPVAPSSSKSRMSPEAMRSAVSISAAAITW